MTSNARELAQIPSTPSGRRNIAYNGAMQVAQRGTQTGQTDSGYTACDRFLTAEGGAAVSTSSQSTDVPSGQGFANSLKIDITTADTDISANDFFLLIQRLEGQDLQRLCYGTSSAKDLTISFWIKSPKTGTHIFELRHQDATYYNAQAYTIASANTWQKVTLTYSGYTPTAFDNDNNHSLSLHWWFAAGSNFSSGTLQSNTWQNTEANRAAGQVNCVDSASNEIYITGVQMEVGSVATEFEHRSFGEELALCQRYFQLGGGIGRSESTSTMSCQCFFHPTMRATPTITVENTSLRCGQLGIALVNITSTASAFMNTTNTSVGIVLNTSSTSLTAGQVAVVAGDAFGFSAEL